MGKNSRQRRKAKRRAAKLETIRERVWSKMLFQNIQF